MVRKEGWMVRNFVCIYVARLAHVPTHILAHKL